MPEAGTPVRSATPMDLSAINQQAMVAEVGLGRVRLMDVMDQWGPNHGRIIGQALANQITPAEADQRLQEAWTDALQGAIRDELFYQEAKREYEYFIQKQIDAFYAYKKAEANRDGGSYSRQRAERELREMETKRLNQAMNEHLMRLVKAAGGTENLARVLKARGITFNEWKSKLVRKNFTYGFFSSRLGSKQVNRPRPKDVARYYKQNPEKFTTPGRVVFQHLYVDNDKHGGPETAYARAEHLWQAIDAGRITFAAAVAKYSDDPIGQQAGGLVEQPANGARGEMLEQVHGEIQEEALGKLAPLLVGETGVHLVIPLRRLPGRKTPWKEAQKEIEQKMIADNREAEMAKLEKKLREEVRINVLMPDFPPAFGYQAWAADRPANAAPVRRLGPGADPARGLPASGAK